MDQELYTGAVIIIDESEPDRALGAVGAFGTATETSTVRFSLYKGIPKWEIDEDILTIELPERVARQLAENLIAAEIQIKYLRTLRRLGKLVEHPTDDAAKSSKT